MPSYSLRVLISVAAITAFLPVGAAFRAALVHQEYGGKAAGAVSSPGQASLASVAQDIGTAAFRRLRGNFSPEGARRGAVIAAPSGNPEYQFHWVRDGAIVMKEQLRRLQSTNDATERAELMRAMDDWVDFNWDALHLDTATEVAETAKKNGEPKYTPTAGAFTEEWGRPQNDGPGLRAMVTAEYANWLLKVGRSDKVLDPRANLLPLLRDDLKYLSEHWQAASYDVWEEVMSSTHYYNRAVQRAGFERGAEVMQALGRQKEADYFRRVATQIQTSLDAHWDEHEALIRTDVPGGVVRGKDYKESGLDMTVILAALHTDDLDALSDPRVVETAYRLEEAFRYEYPINHGRRERTAWIGRYPEDRYTGQPFQDRIDGGNPWFLTTVGMGEFHYRVAKAARRNGSIRLQPDSSRFYLMALDPAHPGLPGEGWQKLGRTLGFDAGTNTDVVLRAGDARFERLVTALEEKGDDFVERALGSMRDGRWHAEQIDRNTGELVGAEMLTWNDAALHSAMRER